MPLLTLFQLRPSQRRILDGVKRSRVSKSLWRICESACRASCIHYPVLTGLPSGKFKTGVTPLRKDYDVIKAAKNLSEELPPINDVEMMFDHLTSRVSHCQSWPANR